MASPWAEEVLVYWKGRIAELPAAVSPLPSSKARKIRMACQRELLALIADERHGGSLLTDREMGELIYRIFAHALIVPKSARRAVRDLIHYARGHCPALLVMMLEHLHLGEMPALPARPPRPKKRLAELSALAILAINAHNKGGRR